MDTSIDTINTLFALRSSTHDVHERLHIHPILSNLMTPGLTHHDYLWVLFAFERFYQNICACVGPNEFSLPHEKLNLITADMRALNAMKNPLPMCTKLRYEVSSDQVLGVKYVVIGSLLGGSLISKNIEKRLGLKQDSGNAFFGSSPEKLGLYWRNFQDTLEQECISTRRCTAAALHTFEALEKWLWDVVKIKNEDTQNGP